METNIVIQGDSNDILSKIESNSIDTCITDPPYGLKFKGNKWDYTLPSIDLFKKIFNVLKPGATMLCFGGSRTFHRLAINIEDSGFHIMDTIMWIYDSGFPKSVDIAYMIDKNKNNLGKVIQTLDVNKNVMGGGENIKKSIQISQPNSKESEMWNGWGTALKPSYEPILVCRKPIEGNYDDNALNWGVSGYWIDGCRVDSEKHYGIMRTKTGRWPANLIIDESVENNIEKLKPGLSKIFYCAKPTKEEKGFYNDHDTVKPLKLLEYLCNLTKTPTGGVVLDPFAGSGTTALACLNTDRKYILIEKEEKYINIINQRLNK